MTQYKYFSVFLLLVIADSLATYFNIVWGQFIARPAILLGLAFYYFQQVKPLSSLPDYLMLLSFIVTLLAEIFFINTPLKSFWVVTLFLFVKVTIVLYLIAREYRFYEAPLLFLTLVTLLMIAISLLIVLNFNNAKQFLFIECLFTCEIGIIFSLALFRKVNKFSFETMVMGVMTSAFSIILMSNNIYNYQSWLDVLARAAHAAGLVLFTIAVLKSSLMRKS